MKHPVRIVVAYQEFAAFEVGDGGADGSVVRSVVFGGSLDGVGNIVGRQDCGSIAARTMANGFENRGDVILRQFPVV